MLQLGQMIANSVATVAFGIGLTAVGTSYARNIPDPIAQISKDDGRVQDWMDPETTGAIIPKAEGASAHVDASQREKTGSTEWVDPPRRSKAAERSASMVDETMELRLPRP